MGIHTISRVNRVLVDGLDGLDGLLLYVRGLVLDEARFGGRGGVRSESVMTVVSERVSAFSV